MVFDVSETFFLRPGRELWGRGGAWGAGLYGRDGIYNIVPFVCKLNPTNDLSCRSTIHAPPSVRYSLLIDSLVFIYFFLSNHLFTGRQKEEGEKIMFGFQKEDDFNNKLELKKEQKKKKRDNEVVQCFIIFMYLNTMLLQYC